MKIIRVPYNRSIQSILDSLLTGVAVSGVVFMVLAIFKLDWKAFIIGSLIAIPPSVFLWKTMTLQILIWTTDFASIKVINDINELGFTLSNNKKHSRILWENIQEIELANNNNLLVKLKGRKEVKIGDKYFRWYSLLQNIPNSKLQSSKIPDFLKRTFENLKTCKVCGSIAVLNQECLSCRSITYNQDLEKEFTNEIDYIKSEQLELFMTNDKNEKVEFYQGEKDGFERDKNWIPIVTEKEVIEYSRENLWE